MMRDSVENLNNPHPLVSCSPSLSSLCKWLLGWSGMDCISQIHTDYFWSPSCPLDSENAFQERLLQHLSRHWCKADQTEVPWILLPMLLEDWSDIHTHHCCKFLTQANQVEEELSFHGGLEKIQMTSILISSAVQSMRLLLQHPCTMTLTLPSAHHLSISQVQPIWEPMCSHSPYWRATPSLGSLRWGLWGVSSWWCWARCPAVDPTATDPRHTALCLAPGPCCAAPAAQPMHSRASLHLVLPLVGAREEHSTNAGAGSSRHRDQSTLCSGIAGWAH